MIDPFEARLQKLEAHVKEQKQYKPMFETLQKDYRKLLSEHETLQKSHDGDAELIKHFRDLFHQLLPQSQPSQPATNQQIHLEHRGLEIRVNHDRNNDVVKMSTTNTEGKIIYCALKDLQKESLSEAGWTSSQLRDKMLEHGWTLKDSTFSAKLSILAGEGKLIKTPSGYRLPEFVPFEIQEVQQ